jgi:hypothetical protein
VSGFLSVRLSKDERKKLLAIKAERGCATMSQAIRLLAGFPRGVDEAIDGSEDIDGITTLIKEVILLRDRVDTSNKLIFVFDQEMRKLLGERARLRRDIRVEDLDKPLEGPMEFRNGDKHPALPEGFQRS